MKQIAWVNNTMPRTKDARLSIMAPSEVTKARAFHRTIPGYAPTPLVQLTHMAKYLGLSGLFVKDESFRFGLNAFKVLGGSLAMAKYIAGETGRDIRDLSFEALTSQALRDEFGQATFFTATDGNHGRGVAWAARRLGQKAVVFMPKGSTSARLAHIRAEHATATIEEVNYDECVRMAAAAAAETKNGVVIQDTAWEGYEEIPSWIMQGYGTMADEASEQLSALGIHRPTHVFLQAGVGSLAGAVQGYFACKDPKHPPVVIVVEADTAACLYKGACKGTGTEAVVTGDMPTIMAGLACGEPNTIAWDILKNHVSVFAAAPDWTAAKGMRMLAAPLSNDPRIVSGESGAVTLGVLAELMTDPSYADFKNAIGLNQNSRVLLFSTEGDTDPERYRQIVWDGQYQKEK